MWISPWIKSISNELDIIIHVIVSQLSGHCDVISKRLWRNQQNVSQASETRVKKVWKLFLSSFMDSFCRVRNKRMYVRMYDERLMHSPECYFGVYFPRCCVTRAISTKINLLCAHKQFDTRVHTREKVSWWKKHDVIKWKHFPRNWPFVREFPAQRQVTRSFDVFFDLRLNKRLSKQSRGWWFETLSRPSWRHCNVRPWQ